MEARPRWSVKAGEAIMKTGVEVWFYQTELLISGFWLMKDRIARLKNYEKYYLKNINLLKLELSEFKYIPSLTAKYGILNQIQRNHDYSYANLMAEYEKQVDKITELLIRMYKKLISIQQRIWHLEESIVLIEMVLSRLSDEEKMLMEQKYAYKRSNYQTADLLHCSEKRVRNMHRKIIEQIAEWLNKKKSDTRNIENFNLLMSG